MIFRMEELQSQAIIEPALLPSPVPAPAPDASPSSKGGKARMRELSPSKRRALGRKAAAARWGKQVVAADATTAANTPKNKVAGPPRRGRTSNSAQACAPFVPLRASRKQRKVFTKQERVFGIALAAAEKRLATAIEERARAASTWAILNAEIPSLQRTIAALRNQQNPAAPVQSYEMGLPDGSLNGYPPNAAPVEYNLTSVLSDAPVPQLRPAPGAVRSQPQAQPPAIAQPRPLVNQRVFGGAAETNLGDDSDEDQFLDQSSVAGGVWR